MELQPKRMRIKSEGEKYYDASRWEVIAKRHRRCFSVFKVSFRGDDNIKDCLSFVCPLMVSRLFSSCFPRGTELLMNLLPGLLFTVPLR